MRRTLLPVAVITIALGACGSEDPAADSAAAPDTSAAPTTTVAPATTTDSTTDSTPDSTTAMAPTTSTAPTTEPPTTEPPTTEPPASDCLVGAWVVTEAEMNAFYDAIEALIDQPIDFTISGETGLTFTDSTYEWAPRFSLSLDLAGLTGSGDAGGTITGAYSTADGILSTELGESALTMVIQLGGQTIDGAALGNGIITSVPFVDSPYSCDGPTPVIEFETIDDRHPVTLTPAAG